MNKPGYTTVSIKKKLMDDFHRAVFQKHRRIRGVLGEEVANALRAYIQKLKTKGESP